ncbi:MAG: phosphotransferase family protein [Bacteroidota bacterium]
MPREQPAASPFPFNVEKLHAYLQSTLGLRGPATIGQFPHGFSNLTYRVILDDEKRGPLQLVVRRPPVGADVQGGHNMTREWMMLDKLHGHLPVPKPLAYDGFGNVIGAPFYVMERVHGVILRGTTTDIPDAATVAGIAESFVDTFAMLHGLDLETIGLAEFGKPEGYVRRQVEGWAQRWQRAQTDPVPDIDRACAWLDKHQPGESYDRASAASLIHNDFKHDNLILDPDDLTQIRAILDWELATVGDPLMDLGSTLGYWIEPGDHPVLRSLNVSPTTWPGTPTREEFVAQYEAATGRPVEHVVFYYVYGLVKLAVIAQQIYARWQAGVATDARFEHLIHAVRACGETVVHAIERQRISALFD